MQRREILRVIDLHKNYGDRSVLAGVGLRLTAGSIAVLAGDNGTGKTTLLRCIAGLARYQGDVRILGVAAETARREGRVAYVPQSVQLPETATVSEVLDLFAKLRRVDMIDLPEGFLPPLASRIGTLSGGQRQRVVFVAATAGDPSLLLFDEPAANLDEAGRDAIWAMVRTWTGNGAVALIASPSPENVAVTADAVFHLHDGVVSSRDPSRLPITLEELHR